MKIVFVTDYYFPQVGGIEIETRRLAQSLSSMGNDVSIIAPSDNTKDIIVKEGRVTVYGIGSILNRFYRPTRIVPQIIAKPKIFKILDYLKPDVIHIQSALVLAKTASLYVKKNNVAAVATGHYAWGELERKFHLHQTAAGMLNYAIKSAYKSVWENINILTVPSEFSRKKYISCVPKSSELITVSNGIDTNRIKKNRNFRNRANEKIILFAGRLEPSKNVRTIIRAMPKIIKNLNARLVVMGSGQEEENIKKDIIKYGLTNKITLTGHLPQKEILKWYRKADIFVTASIAENQPLTVLEAMSCSLPVIASNTGGTAELVKNGVNGFLFKPSDYDSLSNYVLKIFGDDRVRIRMGDKSREFAVENDIFNSTQTMLGLYQKSIALKEMRRPLFETQQKSVHRWLLAKSVIAVVLVTLLVRWTFFTPVSAKAKNTPIKERIKNLKIVKSVENLDNLIIKKIEK